ncbi:Gfo/Idh/MocA family oxidoreductase [Clostridium sp. 19966]|uniref:Gfo/Idh/MocA family protein n=1 Tax=Clostridium sp. 19966 TaxID=2768166 RepID=UPI0028DD81D4|nr:Gfo/Idh/MocA family oxidoreductase [Clostridium sp. 19966]MDT8718024.1 Gfo/Idh/MocA family oxidoreductase [Clostridium sp. 19966]
MKIAILGAGSIARSMAATINQMDEATNYAVASRDYKKSEAFAKEFGFAKAYGSYEEMLSDPEVELVYVATPHSHHYEHVKMCLNHGKHVLCEKSFAVNTKQAREMLDLAEGKKLLLTEAIWTRYMPLRRTLDEVIATGIIGKVHMLTANLGYVINHIPRLIDPALAGGALLDVGVYPINFALMTFGNDIERIESTAVLTDRGVDAQNSITLVYKDGRMAVLNSTMMAQTDRLGIISGSKGFIVAENINNCERFKVFDINRKELACYEAPKQISGYEYQVISCIKAIKEGRLECEEMPHKETIRVMEIMDSLRKQWGVIYPGE